MSLFMVSMVVGVISGLASIIIWEIGKGLYSSWMSSRPTRIFWDFLNADVSIIISAHLRKVTELMVPFVPLGDLKAYATIIRYFSQKTRGGIYRHNRVQCSGSEENWEDQKGKNLVIIGGPFYNKAANTVLVATCSRLTQESKEQLPHLVGFWKGRSYKYDALEPTYSEKPPFQIALDLKRLKTYGDDTFSTSDFNRMHCPKIDLKTYTGCDYGLLIKCTNIYSYNKTVVILYGAHHYGTDGVARFVTDNRYLNELLQATKSRNNLWALVECIVSAGNITGVKLKDSGTLNFAGN